MRDKEAHNMLIKRLFHREDITVVSIHTLNIRTSKYKKETLAELQGEIDVSVIIVEDFHILCSTLTNNQ